MDALGAWWDEFNEKSVSVPLSRKGIEAYKNYGDMIVIHQDPESEEAAVLLDPRIVNNALSELGTKVEVWWVTKQVTARSGRVQNRHTMVRGRFRLG